MAEDPRAIPIAPRYNIAKIFQMRDRLSNDSLTEFAGFAPRGDHFEDLVNATCRAIPRVRHAAVWDSLRYLAGESVTLRELRVFSWRLAGNLQRLRDGIAVSPWHVQRELEWVPAQIMSWEETETNRGRPAGLFKLRVLAGTACPMLISTMWPKGFCGMISRRVGYSASWGKYPYRHPSELVSMRIWALIDPERCRPGAPGFHDIGCSAGLLKWNKDIIRKRCRQGWECPEGYDHPCFTCGVGYGVCPAATHREMIVQQEGVANG